jgi:hypothetical protein
MGMKISEKIHKKIFFKDKTELNNYNGTKPKHNCTESFVTTFTPQNIVNRSVINENHLYFYDSVVKLSDAAIGLLDQFFNLFENGKGALNPGVQYGIYDLEKCEVINSHFNLLFIWIDKILRDCARLQNSSNSKDVAILAIDFIDTVNIFLSETLYIFERSSLDNLELNIFLSDGTEIINLYKNSDHQFEKIFFEYIEDMDNSISKMVSNLKLKSNELIIERFKEIVKKGQKMLQFKMLNSQEIIDEVDKDVNPIIKYELYLIGKKTEVENNNPDLEKLKKEINGQNENNHSVELNETQYYEDTITDSDSNEYVNDIELIDEVHQMNATGNDKRYVKDEKEYKKEVDEMFKEIYSTETSLQATDYSTYEKNNNVSLNAPLNTNHAAEMRLAGFETKGIESNLLFLLVFTGSVTVTLLVIGLIGLCRYLIARNVKENEREDRIVLSEEFELEELE